MSGRPETAIFGFYRCGDRGVHSADDAVESLRSFLNHPQSLTWFWPLLDPCGFPKTGYAGRLLSVASLLCGVVRMVAYVVACVVHRSESDSVVWDGGFWVCVCLDMRNPGVGRDFAVGTRFRIRRGCIVRLPRRRSEKRRLSSPSPVPSVTDISTTNTSPSLSSLRPPPISIFPSISFSSALMPPIAPYRLIASPLSVTLTRHNPWRLRTV